MVRNMGRQMTQSRSSLRERRRWQTAREIQHATLGLVRQHGYAALTTEMIAAEAGISLRTFFNYYQNKEAALVGPPARMDETALAAFSVGTGPLIADFAALALSEVRANVASKTAVRTIGEVIAAMPDIELAFIKSLSGLSAQIAQALAARPGAPQGTAAEFLAEMLTHALGRAFRAWGEDEAMTPDEAIGAMTADLTAIARALNAA